MRTSRGGGRRRHPIRSILRDGQELTRAPVCSTQCFFLPPQAGVNYAEKAESDGEIGLWLSRCSNEAIEVSVRAVWKRVVVAGSGRERIIGIIRVARHTGIFSDPYA